MTGMMVAPIDKLEFCHCDLNRNLNELVRGIEGAQEVTVLGCSDVSPEHKDRQERYARALEAWLGSSSSESDIANHLQTVYSVLGEYDGRKNELVDHLIKRLRDNRYEFYAAEDEDFETTDSRIQHLEICCFNWEQNLIILLDEIGKGRRTYGWHGIGLFCACGDKDPNNNYPKMVKAMLDSIEAKDELLLAQLKQKLEEVYPG
ncbi:MAG: hypothetical protein JSW16_07060 [Dehalococcoidales bacterium]|nr:MAG: hypothetical protein JSW16_07060 [Dehalococcoidales bacterium]